MHSDILIPARKLNTIFGTAYPNLDLDSRDQQKWLNKLAKHRISEEVNVYRYLRGYNFLTSIPDEIEFKNTMVKLRSWIDSIPPRRFRPLSRWYKKIFNTIRDNEIFMIRFLEPAEVFDFIQINDLKPEQYQFFSTPNMIMHAGPFIIFVDPEISTLFKLQFAEDL